MITHTRLAFLLLAWLPLAAACHTTAGDQRPGQPTPSERLTGQGTEAAFSRLVAPGAAECHVLFFFPQGNRYHRLRKKPDLEKFVDDEIDKMLKKAGKFLPTTVSHKSRAARKAANDFLKANQQTTKGVLADLLVAGDDDDVSYVYIGGDVYCNPFFALSAVRSFQRTFCSSTR